MHHNRPYPNSKPKKKFKFWEQPESRQQTPPNILLSKSFSVQRTASANLTKGQETTSATTSTRRVSSFSDYQKMTPDSRRRYREATFLDEMTSTSSVNLSFRSEFDADWIHPSNGKISSSSRQIQQPQTISSKHVQDDGLDHSLTFPRVLWNGTTDASSSLQTQLENLVLGNVKPPKKQEEKDEIMDGLAYDSDEIMTPVKVHKYVSLSNAAAVSPAITPLVLFETPEKTVSNNNNNTYANAAANNVSVDSGFKQEVVTPTSSTLGEGVLSPPNAPKKERIHKTPSPFGAFRTSTKTPPTVGTATTVDSSSVGFDVVPMDESFPRSCEEDELMVKMIDLTPTFRPAGHAVWQSLYQDEQGYFCVIDVVCDEQDRPEDTNLVEVTKTLTDLSKTNSTLREGDAVGGKSTTLKLFVDTYQQSTFNQIVERITQLKGLRTLVVCRGLNFSESTYRTNSEMRSLLDAVRPVRGLDSLMLLNFRPHTLVDLAKTLNQHPTMYRLQIHLAEGTLNGELLGVIATAPKLTHVQLEMKDSCAIGTLINSKSIQTLRVASQDIALEKSHVRTLIYGLQSNITMTTLDLAPTMSVEHFRSLCSALKKNDRLESLRVNLKLFSEEDSQIAAVELANLISINRTLVSIWNFSYELARTPNSTGKRILYRSLRRKSSLEDFKFFSEDPNPSWDEEEAVLGIEPRDSRHVILNKDDPSLTNSASFDTNDSYLQDDCFDGKFFDQNLFTCGSDCIIPDIGEVIRSFAGTKSKTGVNTMPVL
jgi:hypothetical protein